jgi:hypothetical protein
MMSALPPKEDISWHHSNVRFVPKADVAPAVLRATKKSAHKFKRLGARWHR